MSPVGKLLSLNRAKSFQNIPPNQPSKLPKLVVLLIAGCLTTMTGGIVSPILPEIELELLLDEQWTGVLVSMHALMIALFTPVLGILADRIGKLRVMIPSLILYALVGASGALMQSFLPLLATRVFLGIASAGIAAASIGLLGNMYEGEARSRVLGYATSAMTTASILVPIVGGWVGSFNWRYAFLLYGLGLPTALLAAIILQGSGKHNIPSITAEQGRQLSQVVRQPQAIRLYITLILASAIVYSVVIYTPLYLKAAIGADPVLNGTVLAVRAVGAAIVSALLASRLAKLINPYRTIALGFTLMAITLATIPWLTELEWILPTAVLFGMGFGIVIPNIYDNLATLAPAELRASVLAIGTGLNSLGQFLSPVFLGQVRENAGLPAVFYVAAGLAIVTAVLSLTSKRQPLCTGQNL